MSQHQTYTAKDVVTFTGIPHNTLNSWHARGLLRPLFGAAGSDAPSAGVARRYSLREVFELLVVSYCLKAAYEPRVAVAIGYRAGDYTPRLDGDNGTGLSLVIAGYAVGDEADPEFQVKARYKMRDSEFNAEFMPTMRERHGDCGIYILPLSVLQARLLSAIKADAS